MAIDAHQQRVELADLMQMERRRRIAARPPRSCSRRRPRRREVRRVGARIVEVPSEQVHERVRVLLA